MKGLEKRSFGKVDASVTFMGFGALEIGRDWGMGDKARPEEDVAIDVLNGALDAGITMIDTASAYHLSEARIGKGISSRRAGYFLASKCGEHSRESETYYDFSYAAISESVDRSLELLQTEQIDLMQIHFGPNAQQVVDDGETVRAMQDARAAGKTRLLGASCGGPIAEQCVDLGVFDALQVDYSLLNRRDEALIARCAELGMGVVIKGGVARGRLTPKVLDHLDTLDDNAKEKVTALLDLADGDGEQLMAIALNFLYQNNGVTSVLLGSKNLAHVQKNMELLEREIDKSLMDQALALTV
jgi:aryl-alcohol dehydrogenase-like predicted oxidoreductase